MTTRKTSILLIACLFVSSVQASWIYELKTFLKNVIKDQQQVGAIAPCSHMVAREITKNIRSHTITRSASKKTLRILEVGAGVGNLTEEILRSAQQAGVPVHTDIIEINDEFCAMLQKRFGRYENAKVHCQDVCNFNPEEPYDIIISTLPFTNMDVDVVAAILEKYRTLIKPDGVISYVEYVGLAQLKLLFMRKGSKRALYKKKLDLLENFRTHFATSKATILGNIPPIHVYHLTNVA